MLVLAEVDEGEGVGEAQRRGRGIERGGEGCLGLVELAHALVGEREVDGEIFIAGRGTKELDDGGEIAGGEVGFRDTIEGGS